MRDYRLELSEVSGSSGEHSPIRRAGEDDVAPAPQRRERIVAPMRRNRAAGSGSEVSRTVPRGGLARILLWMQYWNIGLHR